MIPLIVPDVNVMLSGTTISGHAPSQIIQAWRRDEIHVATSEPILEDLRRAFTYPKVTKFTKMTDDEVENYIDLLRASATVVPGSTPVKISPDSDDDKLFSCAIEANANYIVSMDKKHVLSVSEYKGVKTMHPTEFVGEVLKLR
jgi:hypothetical protein